MIGESWSLWLTSFGLERKVWEYKTWRFEVLQRFQKINHYRRFLSTGDEKAVWSKRWNQTCPLSAPKLCQVATVSFRSYMCLFVLLFCVCSRVGPECHLCTPFKAHEANENVNKKKILTCSTGCIFHLLFIVCTKHCIFHLLIIVCTKHCTWFAMYILV